MNYYDPPGRAIDIGISGTIAVPSIIHPLKAIRRASRDHLYEYLGAVPRYIERYALPWQFGRIVSVDPVTDSNYAHSITVRYGETAIAVYGVRWNGNLELWMD